LKSVSVSGAGRTDEIGLDIAFTNNDDLSCKVSAGNIMKPVVGHYLKQIVQYAYL